MARSSRLQVKPFCKPSKKCPRSLNGRQRQRDGRLAAKPARFASATPHRATFNAAVPSAIRAFRRAYPEVDLTLEEANTTPLVTGLREGTLDAVFVRPGTPDTEKLQLRRVAEEPVVIALAKRHPVAALEKIDLARLENDPFLLFSREIAPGLYDTVVNACRKAGFEPIIGQVVPHMTAILNLVAAELGVSIVPASMMQVRVTGIAYRQIARQSPTTWLALAYRRGETSPIVRNFVARAVS
jgi:DNA-binding transcriptional LysR family regulator